MKVRDQAGPGRRLYRRKAIKGTRNAGKHGVRSLQHELAALRCDPKFLAVTGLSDNR